MKRKLNTMCLTRMIWTHWRLYVVKSSIVAPDTVPSLSLTLMSLKYEVTQKIITHIVS